MVEQFFLRQPCLHKAKAFRLVFQVGTCECVTLEDYESFIINEIFTEDVPLNQYVNSLAKYCLCLRRMSGKHVSSPAGHLVCLRSIC